MTPGQLYDFKKLEEFAQKNCAKRCTKKLYKHFLKKVVQKKGVQKNLHNKKL